MVENTIDYWKKLAFEYKKNWEACQEELEEFQSSSRELEQEMETQLEHHEKRARDLTSVTQKQQSDLDSLREKYIALQNERYNQVNDLESEITRIRSERDDARKYIRELEQLNDDLERAKRNLIVSLEDFEKRMNEAIERNVLLESELDEKDVLAVSVQRLKEETRDLKQELQVRERTDKDRHGNVITNASNDTAHFYRCSTPPSRNRSDTVPPTLPSQIPLPQHNSNLARKEEGKVLRSFTIDDATSNHFISPPLTPNARISALNIVGDLLRKVGALESKLATSRKYTVDTDNLSRRRQSSNMHQKQQQQHSCTLISKAAV